VRRVACGFSIANACAAGIEAKTRAPRCTLGLERLWTKFKDEAIAAAAAAP
jgi:hypothetical protein